MTDLLEQALRLKELILRRSSNLIVPPGFPADLSRAEEESEEKHRRPYREYRQALLASPRTAPFVPVIVRASEELDSCWNLLKSAFPASDGQAHAKRAEFVMKVFQPLIDRLSGADTGSPASPLNYKRVAMKLGQGLIGATTLNEVDRAAGIVFTFLRIDHPESGVTSARSQRVIDWVLSLAEQPISESEKAGLLRSFVEELVPEGGPLRALVDPSHAPPDSFWWAALHPSIRAVAESRFTAGHRADAVEAALKEVNLRVKREYKTRTGSELDGKGLMMKAFAPQVHQIVLADQTTESGKNEQEGYMFLFAGAMRALRNPKAHANLNIDESRAIHHLVVASLLMSKLDEAKVAT